MFARSLLSTSDSLKDQVKLLSLAANLHGLWLELGFVVPAKSTAARLSKGNLLIMGFAIHSKTIDNYRTLAKIMESPTTKATGIQNLATSSICAAICFH